MSGPRASSGAGLPPRVWVVASHRVLDNEHGHPQPYTLIDEGGSRTLAELGLQPTSYPLAPPDRIGALLDTVDGVLLGGSATNVHPCHYGEAPVRDGLSFDVERDALALPLVRLCIERGVPLIGICRGAHELNVAFGGSLHQDLRRRDGTVTHWEGPDETLDEQYRERHAVTTVAGAELERIAGCTRFGVSSLHAQGVRRLGDGWVAEAYAEDGLVESFRWHDRSRFAWGFQFHPEWGHRRRAPYGRIMAAYVDACRTRLERARGRDPLCA
jgi:putative glutamine amidotransferase